MRKQIPKPTGSELEVLEVLWKEGPCTVRQVNGAINRKRETGYTTTLKIMQIMYSKGMLSREEEGRTHVYRPVAGEAQTKQQLLDKFLATAFGGSAANMVMQALGNSKTTREELNQIRKLLDELEGGKQ